jgi:hypothetical protein
MPPFPLDRIQFSRGHLHANNWIHINIIKHIPPYLLSNLVVVGPRYAVSGQEGGSSLIERIIGVNRKTAETKKTKGHLTLQL